MRSLFPNKTLQLRLVDTQHEGPVINGVHFPPSNPEPKQHVSEASITRVLKHTAVCASGVIATYVLSDTVRQIAIYAAVQKLGS